MAKVTIAQKVVEKLSWGTGSRCPLSGSALARASSGMAAPAASSALPLERRRHRWDWAGDELERGAGDHPGAG